MSKGDFRVFRSKKKEIYHETRETREKKNEPQRAQRKLKMVVFFRCPFPFLPALSYAEG
jgi:hypothetical protein